MSDDRRLFQGLLTLTKNDANTQTLNTGNAPPNTGSLPPNTANSGTPGASVNNQYACINTDKVSALLQIVPVIIKNRNKSVKTNALLDSGSDVTLINKDLASKLNLSGDSKVVNILMLYRKHQRLNVNQSNFKYHHSSFFQKSDINAFVVETLNVQPNSFIISSLTNDDPHLRDINFPILNSSNVDLLIGTNSRQNGVIILPKFQMNHLVLI